MSSNVLGQIILSQPIFILISPEFPPPMQGPSCSKAQLENAMHPPVIHIQWISHIFLRWSFIALVLSKIYHIKKCCKRQPDHSALVTCFINYDDKAPDGPGRGDKLNSRAAIWTDYRGWKVKNWGLVTTTDYAGSDERKSEALESTGS